MGRQFSLTVPLSPPRCITGHQWLLSCPGKALWRLTLSPTACIMALQGDYRLGCFLLRKPELKVSNSVWVHKDLLFHVINSYGCHKKPQVLKGSKKAEIFFFPSCQNSSLWKIILSTPVLSLDIYAVWLPPWICAVWENNKRKILIEKGKEFPWVIF